MFESSWFNLCCLVFILMLQAFREVHVVLQGRGNLKTIVATQRWEQPRSIQVQPDTGVDKLCLINTTYPPPYPAGLGWIRSLPRTKAPLLFPMFWLQEAKEHVPRQHCLALAAEAAGAQAFDAAQVVGHFAAVSERSPFGFILTRKHCAARSDGSKLPVPSQDRRH